MGGCLVFEIRVFGNELDVLEGVKNPTHGEYGWWPVSRGGKLNDSILTRCSALSVHASRFT